MKKRVDIRYVVLLILSVVLGSRIARGQENSHRYLGVGIRSSVFQISELQNYIIPSNRLLVNIDPVKYARAELHGSLYQREWEEPVPVYPAGYRTFDFKETSYLFGGGVFAVYPLDQVKFLLGARLSRNHYTDTELGYSDFIQDLTVETNKGETTILAGVLGGEYKFSKWFSISGEFSLLRMKDIYNPINDGPKVNSETYLTETSLVFRFYPF